MKRSSLICLCIISIVTISGIAKTSNALDFPAPQVSASTSSIQVNIDSQFSIEFEVSNTGSPSSTDSYLTISISHSLDIISWSSTPSLPDLSFYVYEIGDLIWNNQYEQIPAEYILLDVTGHPFDSYESVTITIVFESLSSQSLDEWIKYRASMLPEGVNYPTDVPEVRDPASSPEIDQQGYPVYLIDVDVWNPWDDQDGDGKENFLDIASEMQSLVDYGMPEERIYGQTVEQHMWKFELSSAFYLIAPEEESEVEILSNWVKTHTSTEDYDFVTSELLDNYIPGLIICEAEKDVLTMLPFASIFFHFLPADNTYNWIRWAIPIAFPDPLTILQIVSDDKNLPQLLYAFPCITDGDGYTSHLTGKELLFRFTRPDELTLENLANFGVDIGITLLTAKIGAFLKGAVPLNSLAKFIVEGIIGFLMKLSWEWIKDAGEATIEGIGNFFATLLEDPHGDVDMALFVDDNFMLGSYENNTIMNSTYGEYLGDFPVELMIVYTDQLTNHNAKIVTTAQRVVDVENVTLTWISFNQSNLAKSGSFNETMSEGAELEYGIVIVEGTVEVIPEFPSLVILSLLLMILSSIATILAKRKKEIA